MNLDYWRKAVLIAAVLAVTFAATVWVIRARKPSPEQAVAVPVAQAPSAVPGAQPGALSSSFGVLGTAAPPAGANGRWVGEMGTGSGPKALFSFDLKEANGQLTGTAVFPIGEGPIVNGTIAGNHLSFDTQHRLKSGQLVRTSLSGEISDQEIHLQLKSEGALSQLVVHRAAL